MIRINEIIFVLGMHRSGTSAITRLLNILGADLGKNLLAGDPDINKKGFWENFRLINLHDQILESLETRWYDFRELSIDWWLEEPMQEYYSRIMEILQQDFSSHRLMLVKDPRISRMLPFWLEFLKSNGGTPKCVLVMRNPLEVARSISRRDQFSRVTSLLLWLVYTLDAEFHSRGLARAMVKYETTLTDWKGTVEILNRDLGIQWPVDLRKIEKTIESELDSRLRHHVADSQQEIDDELVGISMQVYNLIVSNPLDEIGTELDEQRKRVYQLIADASPWVESLSQTNKTLFETKRQLRRTREKSFTGTARRLKHKMSRLLKK
jgi:hypothetical protein